MGNYDQIGLGKSHNEMKLYECKIMKQGAVHDET